MHTDNKNTEYEEERFIILINTNYKPLQKLTKMLLNHSMFGKLVE